MASSGTYDFTLDLSTVVEEAYERCQLEARNGYDYHTARRSLDLMFLEWQNQGINLWTIENDTLPLVSGTQVYTLDPERLDVIEASVRTNEGTSSQSDIHMRPVSISTFAQQTNKLSTGRPTQYWIEKTPSYIKLNVWPVPDSDSYSINYYYMKRIEDTGTDGDTTLAVPSRFLPVMIAGLAYYLSMKKARSLTQTLKLEYDESWNLAADADRNKASWRLVPGGYR
jgi:hypothetical protein